MGLPSAEAGRPEGRRPRERRPLTSHAVRSKSPRPPSRPGNWERVGAWIGKREGHLTRWRQGPALGETLGEENRPTGFPGPTRLSSAAEQLMTGNRPLNRPVLLRGSDGHPEAY